jgi:hypothetical protein
VAATKTSKKKAAGKKAGKEVKGKTSKKSKKVEESSEEEESKKSSKKKSSKKTSRGPVHAKQEDAPFYEGTVTDMVWKAALKGAKIKDLEKMAKKADNPGVIMTRIRKGSKRDWVWDVKEDEKKGKLTIMNAKKKRASKKKSKKDEEES